MKIFLIGMPGSGKSTLGKQLAEALQLPFVDLDDEIIKKEKQSIANVFSNKGEAYFREVESEILKEWATLTSDFVMATGGGAPCFHQGIDVINQNGTSIFLDVPVDEIVKRLEHEDHRPLLQESKEKKLEALRTSRIPVYRKAHLHVSNNDANAVEEIVKGLSARR